MSRLHPIRAGVTAAVSADAKALLSITGSNLVISGSAFANLDGGRGGSVLSISGGSAQLQDTTFTACSAAGNGSAVLQASGTTLTVSGSSFSNNYADYQGGAISATRSALRITGSR